MAVPFIDTVELETVALKVAVLPVVGKAAVQLVLLFQESLAPLPVHAPLAAWAEGLLPITAKPNSRIRVRRGAFFMSHMASETGNNCRLFIR
jgi:hypothetical protein